MTFPEYLSQIIIAVKHYQMNMKAPKARIVIVDDSRVIQDILLIKLQEFGYEIPALFESGEELLKCVEEISPDLILMDINLDGKLDGIETARQVHLLSNIPIIYITSENKIDIIERARDTEPFGYMIKPFNDLELYSNIDYALIRSKVEKELEAANERLEKVLSKSILNETRLNALISFIQKTENASEEVIIQEGLNEAVRLTESKIGYFHFVNEDQETLQLFTWSNEVLKSCKAVHDSHYPITHAGIWADCAREKKPVIHNDYQNLPNRKGYPEGHSHLVRHMSVPILENDKIRIIIGVGNKENNYDDSDVRQIIILADEIWKIIRKKRAEKELQESEEKYRRLVEFSPDIIYSFSDRSGGIYYSPSVQTILGYSQDYLYKNPLYWFSIIHEDDKHKIKNAMEAFKKGIQYDVEYRIKDSDGNWRWFRDRSIAKRDYRGEVIIEGIASDITIKVKAQEFVKNLNEELEARVMERTRELAAQLDRNAAITNELKAAYEKVTAYQSALNSSAIITYIDPEGFTKEVNDNYCDLIKMKRSDLIEKPSLILRIENFQFESFDSIWETISSGMAWNGDISHRDSEGTELWLATTIIPFLDEAKIPFQYLSISFDITERKKAREEVKRALQKEKELNQLKNSFIATASHQFKTPLTTIQSSIEILQDAALLLPMNMQLKYERHFGRMLDGVNRLNSLLNDILVLGKMEAGRIAFNPKELDMEELVLSVIEQNFTETYPDRQITVFAEGEVRKVYLDPTLMAHILSNLLSNAFKYSVGKKDPEVKIYFKEKILRIEVIDYGIGIPEKDKEQLFTSFFRASNTTDIPGTGLGLMIVRQMVEIQLGTISFDSIENEFTKFNIEFQV